METRRWVVRCVLAGLGLAPCAARGAGWTHPVAGTVEPLPLRDTSRFGAERTDGERPDECGRGHCGVDLYGERGLPIVAFAEGWVVVADDDAGRRGGRRVLVEHAGGVRTHYLHLDLVRPDLEVGKWVESGEWIGTLGRTGIVNSPAHLHFGLSVADGEERRFVDPLPYLEYARMIEAPAAVSCAVATDVPRPPPRGLAVKRKPASARLDERAGRRRASARP